MNNEITVRSDEEKVIMKYKLFFIHRQAKYLKDDILRIYDGEIKDTEIESLLNECVEHTITIRERLNSIIEERLESFTGE